MMICFYLAHIDDMRDFCIYWCYSTFCILTFSYRAYMGFTGYLCAYTPTGKEKEGKKGTQTAGKGNSRKEKEKSIK